MTTLSDLDGTRWTGSAELWLDPLGNDAARSERTVAIDGQTVRYTWSDEGQAHEGSIAVGDDGADFTDTFHQPEPARFRRLSDAWGLFQVQAEYGSEADRRWRIGLSLRPPSTSSVFQMTIVAPWRGDAPSGLRRLLPHKHAPSARGSAPAEGRSAVAPAPAPGIRWPDRCDPRTGPVRVCLGSRMHGPAMRPRGGVRSASWRRLRSTTSTNGTVTSPP